MALVFGAKKGDVAWRDKLDRPILKHSEAAVVAKSYFRWNQLHRGGALGRYCRIVQSLQ